MINCSTCDEEIPVGEVVYEAVKGVVEIDGIVRSSDEEDSVILCEDCFTLVMTDDEDEK